MAILRISWQKFDTAVEIRDNFADIFIRSFFAKFFSRILRVHCTLYTLLSLSPRSRFV